MKNHGLFSALVFSALFPVVLSAGYEEDQAKFCAKPSSYICEDASQRWVRTLAQQEGLLEIALGGALKASKAKQAIKDGFVKFIKANYAAKAQKTTTEVIAKVPKASKTDFYELFGLFTEALAEQGEKDRVGPTDLNKKIASQKALLVNYLKNKSALSKAAVEYAEKEINQLEAVMFLDFLRVLSGTDLAASIDYSTFDESLVALLNSCGLDLASSDVKHSKVVFQDGENEIRKVAKVLRVCPMDGWYSSFETLVSHELTHSTDLFEVLSNNDPTNNLSKEQKDALTGEFIKAYSPMAACIEKKFGNHEAILAAKKAFAKPGVADFEFWAIFNEYLADSLAAQTLAMELEALKTGHTAQGLEFVKERLITFCPAMHDQRVGHGIDDQFRMDEIFGAHPALRTALGCKTTKDKEVRACTLDK